MDLCPANRLGRTARKFQIRFSPSLAARCRREHFGWSNYPRSCDMLCDGNGGSPAGRNLEPAKRHTLGRVFQHFCREV